jgi:hypothetical protein
MSVFVACPSRWPHFERHFHSHPDQAAQPEFDGGYVAGFLLAVPAQRTSVFCSVGGWICDLGSDSGSKEKVDVHCSRVHSALARSEVEYVDRKEVHQRVQG